MGLVSIILVTRFYLVANRRRAAFRRDVHGLRDMHGFRTGSCGLDDDASSNRYGIGSLSQRVEGVLESSVLGGPVVVEIHPNCRIKGDQGVDEIHTVRAAPTRAHIHEQG